MEAPVVLTISGRDGFFRKEACINCPVDKYCACDGADILFDIDSVMRKAPVSIGEGVKMTEPIKVEKGLLTGHNIYASLSHNGILAICAYSDQHYIIQFTDLNDGRQVAIDVETISLAGFYDGMVLLLTYLKPIREATVKSVFDNPSIDTFKEIEGTESAVPYTDVSLLHKRRMLYYCTSRELFSFNVDTRMNTKIDIRTNVGIIASVTGVDCGVKIVFKSADDLYTYALNEDDTLMKVNEKKRDLSTIFPSTSDPRNVTNAVFKYDYILVKGRNKIDSHHIISFDTYNSVIRVYEDIFLAFDKNTNSWVLLRIITL